MPRRPFKVRPLSEVKPDNFTASPGCNQSGDVMANDC
eukprot:CAMPEP_0204089176 /NCGR_PEP_ID=MMETSP0360-20130528/187374_1 /ASSEMBLY_ACC=CAM_ASM_000342 /TAXON_ID=268821 /ORGANISM="Scrippsiella Hangoei, Strain SHTV-5" /LENGTH=36 /DNA_ID= /DNA_START= /DNA_END= /DNA_ORIENTATION=